MNATKQRSKKTAVYLAPTVAEAAESLAGGLGISQSDVAALGIGFVFAQYSPLLVGNPQKRVEILEVLRRDLNEYLDALVRE